MLALQTGPILAPEGLLAFEQGARQAVPGAPGWDLLRDRNYGETRLLLYRRTAGKSGEKKAHDPISHLRGDL